jgi:heat shock protein HspQ
MKFKIGDHLQEIVSPYHGQVIYVDFYKKESWYLIENDELELVNHWVPESKLELHKQPLREQKLEQLGI